MSDLHLEFERPRIRAPAWLRLGAVRRAPPRHPLHGPSLQGLAGADLVVLAGDIAPGTAAIRYADAVALFLGCPVVFVPGNHEYYGYDFPTARDDLRAAAAALEGRVVFLDRDWARFQLQGEELIVFGCTLWTDYRLNGDADHARAYAALSLNDHRRIGMEGRGFRPEHALAEHRKGLAWLDEALLDVGRNRPSARRLVVTHHAPCRQGLGALNAKLAPAYASDLESAIVRWAPDWWVHGHTHHRHAASIGRTLVASAPRGYARSRRLTEGFRAGEIVSSRADDGRSP